MVSTMNYIQGHIRRLKSAGACNRALRHNHREGDLSDVVDPGKVGRHEIIQYNDMTALLDKVKVRKNSVRMCDMVISVSDDTNIDREEFRRRVCAYAEQSRYKDGLVSVAIHDDETRLHAHISFVPIVAEKDKMRLSAYELVGNYKDLSRLQDDLEAHIGKHFGLVRGEPAALTGKAHSTVAEYRTRIAAFQVRSREIPDLPDDISLLNAKRIARDAVEQARRYEQDRQAALQLMNEMEFKLEHTLEANARQARRLKAAAKSNKTMKDELDRIRAIDLIEVMERYGYDLCRKEGDESIFQTETGHISINPSKGVFTVDWSKKGGRGAIDLVMCLKGCNYKDAVDLLRCDFDGLAVANAKAEFVRSEPVESINDEAKRIELLSQKSPENLNKVIDYLQSRGIPDSLIRHCLDNGYVWANKHGAACFGHRDAGGRTKGMTVRGTIGTFKQCVGDKLRSFFRLKYGKSPLLKIAVESPIDAMSLLALAGSDPQPLQELGHSGCSVYSVAGSSIPDGIGIQVAALDADEAGELGSRGYLRLRPVGCKDWNELLQRADWKLLWRAAWVRLLKECGKRPSWLSDYGQTAEFEKPFDDDADGPKPSSTYKTATEIRDSKKSKNREIGKPPKMG